jgi:hypothetical protein
MRLTIGVAIASLMAIAPAIAQDAWKDKQKEQLLFQEQQRAQGQSSEGPVGQVKPNSGPGVQGPPDTRTGPSTRGAEDNASSGAGTGAGTGTSTGEAGASASSDAGSTENTTKPSQDSSGVQGFPDTRTGPSTKQVDDQKAGTERSN